MTFVTSTNNKLFVSKMKSKILNTYLEQLQIVKPVLKMRHLHNLVT